MEILAGSVQMANYDTELTEGAAHQVQMEQEAT